MKATVLFGLGLLLTPGAGLAEEQPAAMKAAAAAGESCTVTLAQQDEARTLPWQEFDQVGDEAGSFRVLADSGCPNAALAAYDDWLQNGVGFPNARAQAIGTFHRAQLMAITGKLDEAKALFPDAYRTPSEQDPRAGIWNTYLQGVIAFFDHDRSGVEASQAALRQEGDDPFAKRQVGVLQGLLDCFDKDYRTAMSNACRKPQAGS